MQKWPRQQSKYFYPEGFDALVKRWCKYVNVSRGYVEIYIFFTKFEYHVLLFIVAYLLTLPRIHLYSENIWLNSLKPTVYYVYHLLQHTKTSHSAHRMH
jgi:hypothetical protein